MEIQRTISLVKKIALNIVKDEEENLFEII